MEVILGKPLLRTVLAIIWMVLQDTYDLGTFVGGFVMATLVIWFFPAPAAPLGQRPFKGLSALPGWLVNMLRLLLYFLWQLVLSNWQLVRLVFHPKPSLTPGIIRMPLKARTPLQITMLSVMISLTPGTLVMGISKENDAIFIHCIDASDEQEALRVPYQFEEMTIGLIPAGS